MIINDNLITLDDFKKAQEKNKYFNDSRWDYMKEIINIVKPLNLNGRVLEMGSEGLTIVKNCDTMNKVIDTPDLTYYQDAVKTPYPIYDKKYCLFIACQVWEHFECYHHWVFREVMRISERAILTFPYMWKNTHWTHDNIDMKKIAEWTYNVPMKLNKQIGSRMLCYWEF